MKRIVAWLQSVKWVAWVVVAAAVAVGVLILRYSFRAPPKPGTTGAGTGEPLVPPEVQARVEQAEEQALIARVQATATATTQVGELDAIGKIPDGKVRRQRLAAMLGRL